MVLSSRLSPEERAAIVAAIEAQEVIINRLRGEHAELRNALLRACGVSSVDGLACYL